MQTVCTVHSFIWCMINTVVEVKVRTCLFIPKVTNNNCFLIKFFDLLCLFLISCVLDSNEWLISAGRYCCPPLTYDALHVCVCARARVRACLPNKSDNCSIVACRHIKQCVLSAWQVVIPAKLMAFLILLLHPSGPESTPSCFQLMKRKSYKKKS